MRRPLRALLFDVFGTVVDWRSGVIAAVEGAAHQHRVEIDAGRFADDWRARYQPSMEAVRSGARPWTILDALHAESLDALLEAHGAAHAFDANARRDLNQAWWRLDPWPDVAEGLERLRRGFFIATCSNGNVALIANMMKRNGLGWDAILGAEPTRAYKPQPEAYLRSVEMLGLEVDRCMMVAAHNDDLAAARALGLRTAFVPRPTEHGPHQTTDLEPDQDWDVVAPDLVRLAAVLGS